MAHPKSKISKQRKNKRRTHYKASSPQVATCSVTGEKHRYHHAYYVGDDMFYRGKLLVKGEDSF